MTRNWGIPPSDEKAALHIARSDRPIFTLIVSAVFGTLAASIAVICFANARDHIDQLFQGITLVGAVLSAGFGCWLYIWIARPRFADHFSGKGHAFSTLLRFYARAAAALIISLFVAVFIGRAITPILSVLLLCMAGGAGAAAAFQTVLAFVPYYDDEKL